MSGAERCPSKFMVRCVNRTQKLSTKTKQQHKEITMKGVTMTKILSPISLIVCMWLSGAVLARADAVTDWNEIAIRTILSVPTHPGATIFLDTAVVQASVYDLS
jgi:hypothetical protein